MSEGVLIVTVSVLILLACGWMSKMIAEGSEVVDVLALISTCVALGYLAGKHL